MTTKVSIWFSSSAHIASYDLMGNPDYTSPQRWGHAGIKFKNLPGLLPNAYFSFYPSMVAMGPLPNPGEVHRNRQDDMDDEAGGVPEFRLPDRIYVCSWLTPTQERAAYNQWRAWEANPPVYSAAGFNCCNAVAMSLGLPLGMDVIVTPGRLESALIARTARRVTHGESGH